EDGVTEDPGENHDPGSGDGGGNQVSEAEEVKDPGADAGLDHRPEVSRRGCSLPAAAQGAVLAASALVAVAARGVEPQARQADFVRALLAVGALLAAGAGAATLRGWRSRRMRRALLGAGVVSCTVAGLWIGANSPTAGWFGHVVSHGPRDE